MTKIQILDKTIAERIAAGEVVERPASVVKELIENSIDAGATALAIEIREGGISFLRVSDNGIGMARDDAALCVERFATSKLTSEKELDAVKTLGFRGEALPSIANVAQFELLTRARDAAQIEGTRVRVLDGKKELEVAGAPVGTQVIVRNLFYNAPARRKFLKAPLRETELIQRLVTLYALLYPQIAFHLLVDGRESLVAPVATPLERIGAVWGREVAAEMLAVNYSSMDLTVHGFISTPLQVRASREWQVFAANGRPIRSGLLAVMLERPYAGRIPPNRHPLAVIQMTVDQQMIDVNVHPRKSEVRFYQERAIYGAIAHAVEDTLRDIPPTGLGGANPWSFAGVAETPALSAAMVHEQPATYERPNWRAVAQIHNTFILAQSPEGMVIIDQHAAQEQVYFELVTTAAGGPRRTVDLQLPVSLRESDLVTAHLDEYRRLGIELDLFGEGILRVLSVPTFVPLDTREFVTALIQEHERNRHLAGDSLRDKLAAKAACLSAVKAGDALESRQQQVLLDDLAQAYAPATCPHGRPVFITFRLEELERRFLRR